MMEQVKQANVKMIENGSEVDKLTLKTYVECENEVAKQCGFKSSDEWWKARFGKILLNFF